MLCVNEILYDHHIVHLIASMCTTFVSKGGRKTCYVKFKKMRIHFSFYRAYDRVSTNY